MQPKIPCNELLMRVRSPGESPKAFTETSGDIDRASTQ